MAIEISELLITMVYLLILVAGAVAGVLFMAAAMMNLQESRVELVMLQEGTGFQTGLLIAPVAGEPLSSALLRGLQGSDELPAGRFLFRHLKFFSSEKGGPEKDIQVSFELGANKISTALPKPCDRSGNAAFCELKEGTCAPGRIRCTGTDDLTCDESACGAEEKCCVEDYNTLNRIYEGSAAATYCSDEPDNPSKRKGVCEIISCTGGRKELFADVTKHCSVVLAAEKPLSPVPIAGLERPFVCCAPLLEEDMEKIVIRPARQQLEVPLYPLYAGGAAGKVIIATRR